MEFCGATTRVGSDGLGEIEIDAFCMAVAGTDEINAASPRAFWAEDTGSGAGDCAFGEAMMREDEETGRVGMRIVMHQVGLRITPTVANA